MIDKQRMRARATETLDTIERDFHLGDGLYRNVIGKNDTSFLWGLAVLLSALVAASRWDPKRYDPPVRRLSDALRRQYWDSRGPVPGYNASRLGGRNQPSDRYYDDNIWLALAWQEAGEKYSREADGALRFAISGKTVSGGILWQEAKRESCNTCSTAPTMLALHRASRKRESEMLYSWLTTTLRDSGDGLYWDNERLATRRVEKTKWSYNSALPLRYAIATNQIAEAERVAEASLARWFDVKQQVLRDDAAFAHHLSEALLELSTQTGYGRFAVTVGASLETLHSRIRRKENGHYPKHWRTEPADNGASCELLWIASAARAYAFAGQDSYAN